MAAVLATPGAREYVWEARATCAHCGFNQSTVHDGAAWRGPVVLRMGVRCSRCGRGLRWEKTRASGEPGPHLRHTVRCPGCGALNRGEPTWAPRNFPEMHDQYFGLPLWLQTGCCGHVLWAVNEGHLLFLERYVGAKLRERVPNRNGSLPSRLPTWIKLARNRDELLRCLARLRASLPAGAGESGGRPA